MKKYTVILWDVDQTLLNFEKSQDYALRRCFEQTGLVIDEAIIRRYNEINYSFWKKLETGLVTRRELFTGRFEVLLKELGAEGRVSAEKIAPLYQKALGEVYYYLDDSFTLCKKLKKSVRQYVVTNGFGPTQSNKLKLSGFTDLMDGVFISEEIGFSKPDIRYFEECFRRIPDFDRERTIIVGDSLTGDMKGGNLAGIACCWYNPEGKTNDMGVRIDYEIRNLWEVEEILSCPNHPTRN